jgi:release factor glutamine methyltransferase
MLARLLAGDEGLPGSAVLDLCTGSGALAVAAARAGAAEVTAVDVSRRAALSARLNAALNGVRLRVLRGDLFAPVRGRTFDLILANPPYLPSPTDAVPVRGAARAWEGGHDGRVVIDRITERAAGHLRPGGRLLLVQSSICGERETLRRLSGAGLEPRIVARRRGPLGPLMSSRAENLRARGLLDGAEEELLAIRAHRASR